MIFQFELNDADTKFAQAYAEETGESIGEMAKRFMLDGIEDIMDARAADIALAKYLLKPVPYRFNEVINEVTENLTYKL